VGPIGETRVLVEEPPFLTSTTSQPLITTRNCRGPCGQTWRQNHQNFRPSNCNAYATRSLSCRYPMHAIWDPPIRITKYLHPPHGRCDPNINISSDNMEPWRVSATALQPCGGLFMLRIFYTSLDSSTRIHRLLLGRIRDTLLYLFSYILFVLFQSSYSILFHCHYAKNFMDMFLFACPCALVNFFRTLQISRQSDNSRG
jgi:hypothetical protein